MVTVSIGMPVYNGEAYVGGSIEHVLEQTFKDFELVICDNASTDGTEGICRRYAAKDDRIRYHRNVKNLGAAPNYNRTVNLARGRFFKFMAHDDEIEPSYLETCLQHFDSWGEDVVVCYPQTIHIDERGTEVGRYQDNLDLAQSTPHERLAEFLRRVRQCNAAHGLMRLGPLRDTRLIGAYNSSDMVFLAELCLRGQIREVQEPLFRRRMHAQSSLQANKQPEDVITWFDTSAKRQLALPYTRRGLEYLRAVSLAHLSPSEQLACYRVVYQHFLKRYWRHMGSEVRARLRESIATNLRGS